MRTQPLTRKICAFAAPFSAAVLAFHSMAQCPRYDLKTVSACNPGTLVMNSRNDQGIAVGKYGCIAFTDRPYIWYGSGPIVPIPLPSSRPDGYAGSINSANIVIGSMWNDMTGATAHAYHFSGGIVTDLGTLPDHNESQAIDINESDPPVIVGYSQSNVTAFSKRAVRWVDGIIEELGISTGPRNEAHGVNNKGEIVGWMGISWTSSTSLPYFWRNGTTTQLALPIGATKGTADAINNNSEIIGVFAKPNPIGTGTVSRGVLWQDGQVIEFEPMPGYAHSGLSAINDLGQIIGSCWNVGNAALPGFLWQDGVTYPIEQLIPPHPTLTNITLRSINNNGEITGEATVVGGGNTVGILLTPIPPVVADINCDQQVNSVDLMEVIRNWGPCVPPPEANCLADLTDDDRVGVPDLLFVINHWLP